jgi:multicomponent Na+:H+ antiporter subunit B
LLGLAIGTTFLDNVLPLGSLGRLSAGGTLPLLSVTVGLEVAGGILLVFHELFEQLLVLRRRRGKET